LVDRAGTVVFADAKHIGGPVAPRSCSASGSDVNSSGGSSTVGSPSRATSTSAPSSTVNAGAEKASNPGTRGVVPVASVASSVTNSRGFTSRTAVMLSTCVSNVSRVPLVPGRGGAGVRVLGNQQQPGAVPAGAARRREPRFEALAADREQVRARRPLMRGSTDSGGKGSPTPGDATAEVNRRVALAAAVTSRTQDDPPPAPHAFN
jgi:hypothetical protein